MDVRDQPRTRWRRSSFSGDDANCVEIAMIGSAFGVRDAKAPDTGRLGIPRRAYAGLLAYARR